MGLNESHPNLADLAERTLGEIVVGLPGATALFRAAKLDYCCGGQTTLRRRSTSTVWCPISG